MQTDTPSFRLDRNARSFRVIGFTFRSFLHLILAFVVLTLFNLGMEWLPMKYLPERWSLVPIALFMGFILGVMFWRWVVGPEPKSTHSLSPEVRALAKHSSQQMAAISRFRQEHPDASLGQAKERIERFFKTGE
jgi:hypothetical protein